MRSPCRSGLPVVRRDKLAVCHSFVKTEPVAEHDRPGADLSRWAAHNRRQVLGESRRPGVGWPSFLANEQGFEYATPVSSSAYVPPGWPSEVRPPGAPGWEATAIAYLLDCCPSDFRAYRVLRNHPVVLAEFASHFVNGQHDASQRGLAAARTSLSECVEPDVVEAATEAWLEQGARLARTRRSVTLLAEALRGRVFVRRL
jgi:hypothetical protein